MLERLYRLQQTCSFQLLHVPRTLHIDPHRSPRLPSALLSPLTQAHRLLGTALLQLKHYPDAIRSLKKAVDLGSSSGLPRQCSHGGGGEGPHACQVLRSGRWMRRPGGERQRKLK